MPPESGIFLFNHKLFSKIDAKTETNRMRLFLVAEAEDGQQSVVGEEAYVLAAHTKRSIQLELVERPREIMFVAVSIVILYPIPLGNTKSGRGTQVDVHIAGWPDFQHQRGLQEQCAILAVGHDKTGIDRNKRINHIVIVIANSDIVVPTEIVPAKANACKHPHGVSSVEGETRISNVETEIPTP